ncbi:hypothetical protein G7068_13675 [Leucobacter viscericola]|uniref:Uncharacterized protein n=1 Tax=Leucobacter viscericola TaxID=2714935 RepID=A0A6G7XID2_9MICO|nr:hypothetical protein [Leucobacter viscericola]QIK64128.1 hypothetical protein G7068_13675 [Leucobacter viscericola]
MSEKPDDVKTSPYVSTTTPWWADDAEWARVREGEARVEKVKRELEEMDSAAPERGEG